MANAQDHSNRVGEDGPTLASRTEAFGIIIGTERFEESVAFYRDIVGLPVWFEKERLVCLRLGDGYLMVETGGVARDRRKSSSENPTMLRFNVDDVGDVAKRLVRLGVAVEVKTFNWGTVGTFSDPDGNPCEIKNADDPFFA